MSCVGQCGHLTLSRDFSLYDDDDTALAAGAGDEHSSEANRGVRESIGGGDGVEEVGRCRVSDIESTDSSSSSCSGDIAVGGCWETETRTVVGCG